MSQKQWGHGYWKGVHDALNGKIKNSIEEQAKKWVCLMCLENENKMYDRSEYPVSQFAARCVDAGFTERHAKRIYNYILFKEPYGCFVSGMSWQPWEKDYFILPIGRKTADEWQAEEERIAKEAHDERFIS